MTARVMLVDDSTVIRGLLRRVLSQDREIEIVGHAANGRLALEQVVRLRPEVVVLDIEMPEMDGLETLPRLKDALPGVSVIMFSTLTERGAATTLEALSRGADDYVAKPSNTGSFAATATRIHADLTPKIKALAELARNRMAARARRVSAPRPPAPVAAVRPASTPTPAVVVVGVSTGGPKALAELIPALPLLPVPVLLTQHMPPIFTRLLAERLDQQAAVTVSEGAAGVQARPGHVYVAPGSHHMVVRRSPAGRVMIDLDDGPPENSCKPAVDPLFRSAVKHFGAAVLGVVLTGMGADGHAGCRGISAAGGRVMVQDEATSVVWGMPGSVARSGLAHDILPLTSIPAAIAAAVGASAAAPSCGPTETSVSAMTGALQ